MASRPRRAGAEALARRLVAEIYRATDGRPVQWRMLQETIEQRLGFDQPSSTAALLAAAAHGWIRVDPLAERGEAPPHSISLTDEGRRLAK
jgi:hypothetical protein